MPTRRFYLSLNLSFVTALIFFSCLLVFLYYRTHPLGEYSEENYYGLVESNHPSVRYISRRISALQAKRKQLWWAYRSGRPSLGFGIDLRKDATLFSSVFPGYPSELINDSTFWSQYFSRDFDFDTRMEGFGFNQELIVNLSWIGCLDLFKNYGADTLVIGNSQMFRSLYPGRLAKHLPHQKILFCARNAMQPSHVELTATYLKELTELKQTSKLKKIILALPWSWALESLATPTVEKVWQRTVHTPSVLESLLNFDPKQTWALPSWNRLPIASFLDIVEWKKDRQTLSLPPVSQLDSTLPYAFSFKSGQVTSLSELLKEVQPYYLRQQTQHRFSCEQSKKHLIGLKSLFARLSQVTQDLYIYLVPTVPLYRAYFDSCFQRSVVDLLKQASSPSIHIKLDDWQSYGLDWFDYITAHRDHDKRWLDFLHTNPEGAIKVSNHIGQWVSQKKSDDLL